MNAEPLEPTEAFLAAAKEYGLVFDAGDLSRLGHYLSMLLEANTRFNLTAITDPADAWHKHVFDSLTLMPWISAAAARRIADIGSGGGLPGIPLAISLPATKFVLMEATGKKVDFLKEAVLSLALTNVTVVNDRVETIGRDGAHRERYDMVIARAVGRLAVVAELAVPLNARTKTTAVAAVPRARREGPSKINDNGSKTITESRPSSSAAPTSTAKWIVGRNEPKTPTAKPAAAVNVA